MCNKVEQERISATLEVMKALGEVDTAKCIININESMHALLRNNELLAKALRGQYEQVREAESSSPWHGSPEIGGQDVQEETPPG